MFCIQYIHTWSPKKLCLRISKHTRTHTHAHLHTHTHSEVHSVLAHSLIQRHTHAQKADAHLQGHISHREIFINQVSGQLKKKNQFFVSSPIYYHINCPSLQSARLGFAVKVIKLKSILYLCWFYLFVCFLFFLTQRTKGSRQDWQRCTVCFFCLQFKSMQ